MKTFNPSAVENLRASGDVQSLIEALGCEDDEAVRAAAAEALVGVCDQRAAEPLVAALRDEVGCVRRAALGSLKRLSRAGHLPDGVWGQVEAALGGRLYFFGRQEVAVDDFDCEGLVLDIGGGGKGIIGILKGDQVIAIDPVRRELEEAAPGPLKIVMSATDLQFLEESFEVVTSFFALMYIGGRDQEKVFNEVFRVLEPGGRFLIWDVVLPQCLDEGKDIAVFPLMVRLPHEEVSAGYGAPWPDREQDLAYYVGLAQDAGFEVVAQRERGRVLVLELLKPRAAP